MEVVMKIKIPAIMSVLLLIAILIFSGCQAVTTPPPSDQGVTTPPQNSEQPSDVTPQTPVIETEYPLTVTDDLGRTVTIDKMPQRIVSLAPSNTETLFALGLGDKIVGVTDYCDYPDAAKLKPRVASYTTPNTEKLVSVEPDIIFAESIHEKTVIPALEKLNLKVVAMSATSVNTVLNDILLMGKIANVNQKAEDLVTGLQEKINEITDKTSELPESSRPRVLYVIWHDPIWTMGSDTFINDLINYAGGTNIFAGDFDKSRIVSLESIIQKNPQIIIVSGMGTTGDVIYDAITKEQRLSTTDAFVNKQIYKISDSNIIERPGPRIVLGLAELSKIIHPEIFGPVK
jgi:iron complex transport system substrate-binding protein